MGQPLRFDGWSLDPDSGELSREGETIRLQEQPLRILQALLESPGRVVTREALVSRLWPRGIVDFETGLNTAMRRLRTALREDADAPRYIETVPRRGYRFIGKVEAVAQPVHDLKTQLFSEAEPGARRTDCLLIVKSPDAAEIGRRYPLDKNVISIGRGLDNDIVIESHNISRSHTRIEFRSTDTFVVDTASTNGTFINDADKPLREARLQTGDIIRIGDRSLAYLRGADVDAQHFELISRIATLDSASGASNRKHLDSLLNDEIERAQRHGRPLSLLMIRVRQVRDDPDDTGAMLSEASLRSLTATLHKRLRPLDRLGRYGEREFCVLMPETELSGALKLADELPALIAGCADSQCSSLSIIAGVTTLLAKMQLADLYRAAEESLRSAHRPAESIRVG